MKVQCSGCEAAEAVLVCCADEAALCRECDTRIHEANKLASKHNRVPLVRPAKPTQCDICQEKPAYFFCLEDRALLCHGCDMSIHLSNASTSNHRRFLVTGVTASLHPISSQAPAGEGPPPATPPPSRKPGARNSRPPKSADSAASNGQQQQQAQEAPSSTSTVAPGTDLCCTKSSGSSSKTSILEFLTETVPGWKFDELVSLTDATSCSSYLPSEAHFQLDRGFNWYPSSSDHMYSRSVPQMGASTTVISPAAAWAFPKISGPSSAVHQQQQQHQQQLDLMVTNKMRLTTGYGGLVATAPDDAFIVPDMGLQALPEELVVPSAKRRRYCYSELDSMFLSS